MVNIKKFVFNEFMYKLCNSTNYCAFYFFIFFLMEEKSKSYAPQLVVGGLSAIGIGVLSVASAFANPLTDLVTTVGSGSVDSATTVGTGPIGWILYLVIGIALLVFIAGAIKMFIHGRHE